MLILSAGQGFDSQAEQLSLVMDKSGSQRGFRAPGLRAKKCRAPGLQDENVRAPGVHIICFGALGSTMVYNLEI